MLSSCFRLKEVAVDDLLAFLFARAFLKCSALPPLFPTDHWEKKKLFIFWPIRRNKRALLDKNRSFDSWCLFCIFICWNYFEYFLGLLFSITKSSFRSAFYDDIIFQALNKMWDFVNTQFYMKKKWNIDKDG